MPINLDPARKVVQDLVMEDECIITRASTAAGVFDENTGQYTGAGTPATIYEGECSVSPLGLAEIDEAGGGKRQHYQYIVSIPVGEEKFNPEDLVIMTAIHPGGDPSLEDAQFLVKEDLSGTLVVTHRILVHRLGVIPS